jgi:ankyrin repeat protein
LIGATEVARILLEFGADANIAAKDGNTPMHKAAQGGHIEVTEILAAAKGDPTRKNQVSPCQYCVIVYLLRP